MTEPIYDSTGSLPCPYCKDRMVVSFKPTPNRTMYQCKTCGTSRNLEDNKK